MKMEHTVKLGTTLEKIGWENEKEDESKIRLSRSRKRERNGIQVKEREKKGMKTGKQEMRRKHSS